MDGKGTRGGFDTDQNVSNFKMNYSKLFENKIEKRVP